MNLASISVTSLHLCFSKGPIDINLAVKVHPPYKYITNTKLRTDKVLPGRTSNN